MQRRDFFRLSGLSLAGAALGPAVSRADAAASQVLVDEAHGRDPDVVVALRAVRRRVQILPGPKTAVWSYRARLLEGPADTLDPVADSYLGPTLRLRRGQRVRIVFHNRIPEESIVHWHGLHVPAAMDGHPRDAIGRGDRFAYEFDVLNRAGTYMYHPHPHGLTGKQVYAGLAGLLLVTDEEESALGLPAGARDLPLVFQDRRFDPDTNELVYGAFGPGPGGGMLGGFLGDTMMVNGRLPEDVQVRREPYRLRLVNAANMRILKVGWEDDTPLTAIATDGGLLRRPVTRPYVTLAPGERVELWVDFSGWQPGTRLHLQSKEFDPGTFGNFGPADPGHFGDAHMGEPMDLVHFVVGAGGSGAGRPPSRLSSFPRLRLRNADNRDSPRQWELEGRFGTWTINDRTFSLTAVANDEVVRLGALEAWDMVNQASFGPGSMMGMGMPHPMHVHGQPFQVLERSVDPGFRSTWRDLSDGFIDEGWKDTVLVMPGERVRVLKRFDDYEGLFLIHCHMLEHSDLGMMRNFRIEA